THVTDVPAPAGGDGAAALAALGRGLDVAPGAAVLAWPAVLRVPDRAAALAFLDRRVEAAPSDAALLMLRGRLLRRLGRREEALAAVRRALDLDTSGAVTAALRDLLREGGTPSPEDLAASHELVVAALRRRVPEVTCVRCGAEAPSQAWRCRSCGAFDAFP
ncbi:MAG TPA: hypothetical protein VFP50_08340, partial [Anaeromyxobacteraceae bacterium]|nr:hypothetical protein [Anaeromyxobacteraceae bacterium]